MYRPIQNFEIDKFKLHLKLYKRKGLQLELTNILITIKAYIKALDGSNRDIKIC